MSTIEQLEKQTKAFANSNDLLTDIKREMSSEFETIRAKYIKKIKAAIEEVVKSKNDLSELIIDGKHLFVKPKTLTMNGIKVGFQKSKDKIEFTNEDKVIELIEKHLPDAAEDLIIINKKVSKDELIKLPMYDLKKIKCDYVTGTDSVLIKTIDNEIDKFVSSLMKESEAA